MAKTTISFFEMCQEKTFSLLIQGSRSLSVQPYWSENILLGFGTLGIGRTIVFFRALGYFLVHTI